MLNPRESILQHPLFQEFGKLTDFEKVSAADAIQLQAIVLHVAERVGPDLDRIKLTFNHYTEHGIDHLLNVATIIHDFLPKRKHNGQDVVELNCLELTFLWLAILLHDIGMFVSDAAEKQKMLNSEELHEFLRFHRKREALTPGLAAAALIDAGSFDSGRGDIRTDLSGITSVGIRAAFDAQFAEFIRLQHAERVHLYLETHFTAGGDAGVLSFRQADLAQYVGPLCESHNWGVFCSRDYKHPGKSVSALDRQVMIGRTPVNFAYLACCLRLGDILDFDRTRTPMSAFHSIHFSSEVSLEEWNKHLAIQGVHVTQDAIRYVAKCETTADYVAVTTFLNWVDEELRNCMTFVREFPATLRGRYQLHLPSVVDRTDVGMRNSNLEAGRFRFQLEYEQIMRLLMDKSLYPDATLFLRELLQNALDACRFQMAKAAEFSMSEKYVPRIRVWDDTSLPNTPHAPKSGPKIVIQDNGFGMSLQQVKEFFMCVGKSYYRSADFRAEQERLLEKGIHLDACSQFGIGFLSCFMGGDLIEVETYQYGSIPLRIMIHGPYKYFEVERLKAPNFEVKYLSPGNEEEDAPPLSPGTRVTVYLRSDWDQRGLGSEGDEPDARSNVVRRAIDVVAANQEIPITIINSKSKECVKIESRRWEVKSMPFAGWGPYCHEVALRLAPSEFQLSVDGTIRGKGAFWLLGGGDEAPNVERGDVMCYWGSRNVFRVGTTLFIDALRAVCRTFAGESKSTISALRRAWRSFVESPDDESSVRTSLYKCVGMVRKHMYNSVEHATFQCLLSGDVAFVSDVIDELPKLRQSERVWYQVADEVAILLSGDRRSLVDYWASEAVHDFGNLDCETDYRLALFGIEAPGGFQTWDALKGDAHRHNWLPSGVSALVDTYGGSAPQPVASRLFVPLERSSGVCMSVTSACIKHARMQWNASREVLAWESWYLGLVESWCSRKLLHTVGDSDRLELIADLKSMKRQVSYGLYVRLGLSSTLGKLILSKNCDGAQPWLRTSQPVMLTHVKKAADIIGMSQDEASREVQVLCDFFGWDVMKGRPL